jgi:hypothetical protein
MDILSNLRPFSQGNAHEVEEGVVRIYDKSGFPLIEVFQATVEDDGLNDIAAAIVKVLNSE